MPPLSLEQRILFEDSHFIAINKRCGEVAQADRTGLRPLAEEVKAHLAGPGVPAGGVFVGVAHRIDRPVSGVLLLAKSSRALALINRLFQLGQVQKCYWALVAQQPPQDTDTLLHHIRRNGQLNKSYVYTHPQAHTREARLTYRLAGRSDRYFLLEVIPHTGRHHQIRAQLARIGLPIKGDLKYGAPRSNPEGGISLHARSLGFVHPLTGQPIQIVAPPPGIDLWSRMVCLSK